jgi:hypothetical protein
MVEPFVGDFGDKLQPKSHSNILGNGIFGEEICIEFLL